MTEKRVPPGIQNCRAPLNQSFHMPGSYYSDPAVLAAEKEKFFMKDWLCVGRVEEFEKPGDYAALNLLGEPFIIARDKTGKLNAMSNACRHRGVEVATGWGNKPEFMCPYHGWSYELDGKLIGAPYMKQHASFDPKSCRLKPIQLDIWAGWIFINFDPNAPTLKDYVAELDKRFAVLGMEKCKLAFKTDLEFDCNWKLIVENFLDIYHLQVLHADSIGKYVNAEKRINSETYFPTLENGAVHSFSVAASDVAGGKSLFGGNMPWLKDKPEGFAYSGYLQPHFFVFGRGDEVHPMYVWPIDAGKSRVTVYHLFPKEYFDQPGFMDKAAKYRKYAIAVLEEDRSMVASLQRAMRSRTYEPGPMSFMEVGLHNVINYTSKKIFDSEP